MPSGDYIETLFRYYHTAKHLRPRQIIARVSKEFSLRRFFSPEKFGASGSLKDESELSIQPDRSEILARIVEKAALHRAKKVLEGRFEFLGKAVDFGDGVEWEGSIQSRLWTFNLNYFSYLVDLGFAHFETEDGLFINRAEELIRNWIDQNREVDGDAWHPYVISRRAVNWIYFYALVGENLDDEVKLLLLQSLQFQLDHLQKNLEYDLLANHLLSDARALYIGGLFLGDNDMVKSGRGILSRQIDEQILSDGGHFERSPTYHCKVLMDLLDCLSWTPQSDQELRDKLEGVVERMVEFLYHVIFPDEEIPLFNDSTLTGGSSPELLFDYAGELGVKRKISGSTRIKALVESGYYVSRSDDDFMIIDGGKIGPDYQPGHGHCDLFSYEYWLDGDKVVVDSGVYNYEEGEMRDYCRSTGAHNTVVIDGEEQSKIWKSFRVGRRARPRDVELREEGNHVIFEGRYSHPLMPKVEHRRWMIRIPSVKWLILDLISWEGDRRHRATSFIHLHPEVNGLKNNEEGIVAKSPGGQKMFVVPAGSSFSIGEGWYCPEFGKRLRNRVLELQVKGENPLFFGYLLSRKEVSNFGLNLENSAPNLRSKIQIDDTTYRLDDHGGRSTFKEI